MIKIYDIGFPLKKTVKKAAAYTLKYFEISAKSIEVEIAFLSDVDMQELNLRKRNVDRLTDVLSFPAENISFPFDLENYKSINPLEGTLMLGEIYISKSMAVAQAQEYGHSLNRELAFLTVHGMLHLLGFDHIEEKEEKEMKTHAEKILALAKFKRE